MIITIDGPSGTGKSTVARKLAEALHITYFDTGALYRAISWMILKEHVSLHDEKLLKKLLDQFSFEVRTDKEVKQYFVNGEDVTEAIRSPEVTAIVSEISALKIVRDAMRPLQVDFAKENPTVFEGRDLGTVVFPQAEVKFFLTATPKVRAFRRLEDLRQKFPSRALEFSYEQILEEIKKRDTYDSSRELAPLKKAKDAILVDTSDLSIKEVVAVLVKHVKEKMDEKKT